jgi:predicted DNA-binding helix-hairpin-helix protein
MINPFERWAFLLCIARLTNTINYAKQILRMSGCNTDKLTHLAKGALFDITCADEKPDPSEIRSLSGMAADPSVDQSVGSSRIPGISHVTGCGRPMPILKVLQTSHCEFNCNYCSFRRDNDRSRDSMTPTELADTTVKMNRAGLIEGIFLSSGIGSNVRETMTRIVDTGRILREKYGFGGYIHLKILPGSPMDLVEAAGQYADRLSINLEAPSESALRDIAPNKSIKANILKRMQWIETLRRQGKIPKRVGQVTQFVVGGSDDPGANDRALVMVANYLYKELDFRRIYYSSFNPIMGTPLENRAPENPRRSVRLYQADFLMSKYGFRPDDFVYDDAGRLDLEVDPKETWAKSHPETFPIEVTTADVSLLMRVPGIGPTLAKRIVKTRSVGQLKTVDDYLGLGQVARKSLNYILVNGRAGIIERISVPVLGVRQLVLPFGEKRELVGVG